MRTYFILTILCFSTLIVFSQKLELEKASPFTSVKWEKNEPIVQFNNEWYHFEKLEDFSKKEILDFCKKQFGHKWKKRFSEDLVEVLKGLNYQPNKKVILQLSKDGVLKTYTGKFTLENRHSSVLYNRSQKELKPTNTGSIEITWLQAIEDLKQFEKILDSKSSYAQLSGFDYKSVIKELAVSIVSKKSDVNINEFTNEMGKIMAEIGDRHSSIKNEAFNKREYKAYNLRLPFGVATIGGKIVALKQNIKEKSYTYYNSAYPYIKSINGVSIYRLINSYNYRDKKAPKSARFSSASNAIQKYGELLFKNNIKCTDNINVVFSDGINDKAEAFQLTTDKKGYSSKSLLKNYFSMMKVQKNQNFEGLSKTLESNIGYINIPKMFHYKSVEGLENFIENSLENFSDTKALILDVRNNPGGGREILQTFANYIVQPEQSPWIANIAYLRTDEKLNDDEESMSGRYLYNYNSEKLTDSDRNSIDQFNSTFKTQKSFDNSKFSSPFYMVLHNRKKVYKQPVYILVNEKSFSAATVFTSAFKGLPNVKIVGVTTDGSSGNSKKMYLKNSKVRVKVSTMLSFQRNGKTLDGNGTVPDIIIPANEAHVLKGDDNQLNNLIEIINRG